MAVKVIDTSALAAIVFGEPEGQKVATSLENFDLVAPHLLPFELANVCLTKIRRHPSQRNLLITGFQMFSRMAISFFHVNLMATLELATEKSLTFYDASYVWLSYDLNAELVTLDKTLAKAARKVLK